MWKQAKATVFKKIEAIDVVVLYVDPVDDRVIDHCKLCIGVASILQL